MRVAILIAPRDFKDETVSHLQLLLGKKDVETQIASLSLKPCTGYHGAVVKPQIEAQALEPNTFDAILVADGPGVDSLKLYDYRPLLDLLKAFHESKRKIAGIGNGIKVVARANIIKDAKIAKTDEETEKLVVLYRGKPAQDFVVADKNIVTATGVDNIADFVSSLIQEEQ
ncbi:MAG: DJ-1/PfpI family protein [Candidatus Marsarchaeota archaeon]|nr:DJ-1/PfpI family protein [Candidatus Marsarchaeota archaeon]